MEKQRLEAAQSRVHKLMQDGHWHSAEEIRAVGGSEGLRRLRALREEDLIIEKTHVGDGLWLYRVMS